MLLKMMLSSSLPMLCPGPSCTLPTMLPVFIPCWSGVVNLGLGYSQVFGILMLFAVVVAAVAVASPVLLSLLQWEPVFPSAVVALVLVPCPPLGLHLPMLPPLEPGLSASASQ